MRQIPMKVMKDFNASLDKLAAYALQCRSFDEVRRGNAKVSSRKVATLQRRIDSELDYLLVVLEGVVHLQTEYINAFPDSWRTSEEGMTYRKWASTWENINLGRLRSPLGEDAGNELEAWVSHLRRLEACRC